jgi:hypothetical protein
MWFGTTTADFSVLDVVVETALELATAIVSDEAEESH